MGLAGVVMVVLLIAGWTAPVAARERSLDDLPHDVWDVAFAWTEPIKHVARETRRFDPVSGLWFGLLEGSIKSVERTAGLFLPTQDEPSRNTGQSGQPLLRYSF